jgi:hypothetical protein
MGFVGARRLIGERDVRMRLGLVRDWGRSGWNGMSEGIMVVAWVDNDGLLVGRGGR